MSSENVTFVVRAETADADRGITGFMRKLDDTAKKGGLVGSAMQGVGQQLGKIGFSLVATAVGDLTQALGDGIRGAIAEEKGIARLDQALKTNVAGWDGNRDAIEKVITAREGLGFSDDELRDSLGTLVTRSGNVTQALKDQGLAMDYARFKQVDLATASSTVAKALQGNLKALKEMGLSLRSGATQAEIFAAVQSKVAGQAEAFGNTTEGALKELDVAVKDLGEDFGKMLMAPIRDTAKWVRIELMPAMNDWRSGASCHWRRASSQAGPTSGRTWSTWGRSRMTRRPGPRGIRTTLRSHGMRKRSVGSTMRSSACW